MLRPLLLVLAACGDPDPEGGDDDGTPPDTDLDTDEDTDGTPDTDTDTDTDTDGTPSDVIRDPKFDEVALILEMELGNQFFGTGVSIAVREQGVITWAEGFGTADPEGDVPVTPETRFQIGSTTKQMTAALVLRLVEGGILALDVPVGALLPDVWLQESPEWADTATLAHLLSHQGGVADYVDWLGSPDDDYLAMWHQSFFKNVLWANNPPGAFWNYSNPNFTVAGLAAEEHDPLGRYHADMMVEDLFLPLGMTSTVARKADVTEPFALSSGIDIGTYQYGPIAMDDVPDSASVRPAGLVWSTPSDMTLWGEFLLHGDTNVLSDELRAEISTPRVSTLYFDDHLQYAFGLFLHDVYPMVDGTYVPLVVWEHGGNTLSMTSSFLVLPEHDVVVSILSNGYGDAFYETTDALLRVVVDPFPAPTDDLPVVDPVITALHVGSYFDPYSVGPIDITAGDGGALEIAMPLLDSLGYDVEPELVAITSDFYYIDITGVGFVDLAFVRDPGGGPSQWARSRSFVGQRVPIALVPGLLAPPEHPPMLDTTPLPVRLPRPAR